MYLPKLLEDKLKGIAHADPSLQTQEWLPLLNRQERRDFKVENLALAKNQLFTANQNIPYEEVLEEIRAEMKAQGLDGFIVFRRDEFNNEYVPYCNDRLKFATGFTGSAGAALIMQDRAVLFTDGRYTLQAKEQSPHFEQESIGKNAISQWLRKNFIEGGTLGIDARVISISDDMNFRRVMRALGGKYQSIEDVSPVDKVWNNRNRPPMPLSPVFEISDNVAGLSFFDKKKLIVDYLKKNDYDCLVINDLPSIAWLLNWRGRDVPCTPIFLSYMVVSKAGSISVFIDMIKVSDELQKSAAPKQITLLPIEEFYTYLGNMRSVTALMDANEVPALAKTILEKNGNMVQLGKNPIAHLKSKKNDKEKSNIKKAHEVDGVAIVKFLHWMDTQAQDGSKTEKEAETVLEFFRAQNSAYKGPSFESIVGAGPNGAIIHYRVSDKSNRAIDQNSLFLCDSGAQYCSDEFMGTTDITRTLPIGTPSDEMIEAFTRVLKGHIALYMMPISKETTPADIDAAARKSLKEANLDYAHGTGHGVGCYLGVHEGPIGIGKSYTAPYDEGMILSNEPGYYKEGEFGIRIENLVVTEKDTDGNLYLKSLTLAPIDHRLIKKDLLDQAEIKWLNEYHATVLEKLSPHLEGDAKTWLETMTKPI